MGMLREAGALSKNNSCVMNMEPIFKNSTDLEPQGNSAHRESLKQVFFSFCILHPDETDISLMIGSREGGIGSIIGHF